MILFNFSELLNLGFPYKILSNKNNPLLEVRYSDLFPVSLSALSYDNSATDVAYQTAEISFRYKLYEIVTL